MPVSKKVHYRNPTNRPSGFEGVGRQTGVGMLPLTSKDIRLIFDKIGREVLRPASDEFPYEIVSRRSESYHDDPEISKLQAKLSIMLQVAVEREEGEEREKETDWDLL